MSWTEREAQAQIYQKGLDDQADFRVRADKYNRQWARKKVISGYQRLLGQIGAKEALEDVRERWGEGEFFSDPEDGTSLRLTASVSALRTIESPGGNYGYYIAGIEIVPEPVTLEVSVFPHPDSSSAKADTEILITFNSILGQKYPHGRTPVELIPLDELVRRNGLVEAMRLTEDPNRGRITERNLSARIPTVGKTDWFLCADFNLALVKIIEEAKRLHSLPEQIRERTEQIKGHFPLWFSDGSVISIEVLREWERSIRGSEEAVVRSNGHSGDPTKRPGRFSGFVNSVLHR